MARIRRNRRMPNLAGMKVVSTVYVCTGCGERVTHIEAWHGQESAYGLPEGMRWCDECGGYRVRADVAEGPPPASPAPAGSRSGHSGSGAS